MRAPAALLAIPLIAGSAAGLLLVDRCDASLGVAAAAAAFLALCAAASYVGDGSAPEAAGSLAAGALLAGLSLGLSDARAAYDTPLGAWFAARTATEREEPVELEGLLREDAAPSGSGASLTLDVLAVRPFQSAMASVSRGGVRLAVVGAATPARVLSWRAGRRIVLPALLRFPTSYRNPGLPDDARGLARRGIALVGTVKSSTIVEVRAPAGRVREAAGAARAWARRQLAMHVGRWGGPSGGVTTAILIGDRTGLSNEDELRLQRAGTYHVIAISGGNIAILAALLLGAAKLARVPSRCAAGVAIAALLFYALVTNAGASVTRAVTAAVIYLGARILDQRGPPMNALAVAAAGAVASSALAPVDPGFVLSFGATLGILLGMRRILAPLGPARGAAPRLLRAAVTLLAATVCAELALAPVGAVIFSRVTFAGLLLNFAAIPLMTVVQAGGLATLAAAPLSATAATAFGCLTHVAASWLVRSAALVDLAPWLAQDVPAPAWWLVALYYAGCGVALWLPRHARRALLIVAACLALIVAAPRASTRADVAPAPRGWLRVVFFDVAQGDATAVVLPDGRAFLVDAGGASAGGFDIGARVVAPALRSLGVRGLEGLVVTHADPDHAGGAASILRAFRPLAVWEGVPVPPDPIMRELSALAAERHRSWRTVQAGDIQREGAITIRVLHPPPPDWERQRVRNDDSIALEVRMGEVSILLPGDMEAEAERAVLPRLVLAPLVVLKAGHHGSASSSTPPFIAAVRPAAVVFSAGLGNRYGHPASVVVQRYARARVPMFSTSRDGAVILDTDGRHVEIRGWASGRGVLLER